jgi:uncharacterized protein (TIGR02301 family)
MTGPAPRLLLLGLGLGMFASASFAVTPVAQAQFFWSPWFQEQPKARPKPRVKPRPSGDDLPPIVPKESSAPPPPDDRPYDDKLLRLAEILGAVHYLREVCGAQEGQLWRNQMKDILKNEGSTAVRRAKLVNSFNNGYRGYRRTYRTCTSSATLAIARFSTEGAQIAVALAKPSHYASRNAPAPASAAENATGEAAPAPGGSATGEPEPQPVRKRRPSRLHQMRAPRLKAGPTLPILPQALPNLPHPSKAKPMERPPAKKSSHAPSGAERGGPSRQGARLRLGARCSPVCSGAVD